MSGTSLCSAEDALRFGVVPQQVALAARLVFCVLAPQLGIVFKDFNQVGVIILAGAVAEMKKAAGRDLSRFVFGHEIGRIGRKKASHMKREASDWPRGPPAHHDKISKDNQECNY